MNFVFQLDESLIHQKVPNWLNVKIEQKQIDVKFTF